MGQATTNPVTDENLFRYWLERATDDDLASMTSVGDCLAEGLGVEANPEHAIFWWRAAAERRCSYSMSRLAKAYESGLTKFARRRPALSSRPIPRFRRSRLMSGPRL